VVYEALGRTAEALDPLERAFVGRANFLALVRYDPRVNRLRSDPRYQDIERRMGFPHPVTVAP
jgi:hypothetical protein